MAAELQRVTVDIGGRPFRADLGAAHDLAIALDFSGPQPRWFGAPVAASVPLVSGGFSGAVSSGASCNCSTLSITPHCDGTHTECVGHLTRERLDARQVVPTTLLPALLLTVTPAVAPVSGASSRPLPRTGDLLVTRQSLQQAWPAGLPFQPTALILRTTPNAPGKRQRDYRQSPAPYLALEAAALLVERGIEHLVLDLPSADRADDDGELAAHRTFFGLAAGSVMLADAQRSQCTITELAYIDDGVPDGACLLSLQIPALGGDAVPSRPLLYRLLAP